MNLTENTIVADIRNSATSGSNPTDFRIEDSQIRFWVNQTRAMLIAQSIQKRKDISDSWLQNLTCLQLDEVDKSECCEIETNCKILRTVRKIPDTIETSADNFIVRVEAPNGDIISKTTPFESKYGVYSKYTKNKPKWYLKNNYIYIINNEYLDTINVWAIFEDPSKLTAFTSCSGSTCYSPNSPYPCSFQMASDITNIVLKTKVYPFIQMPRDTTNNANDNFDQTVSIKN